MKLRASRYDATMKKTSLTQRRNGATMKKNESHATTQRRNEKLKKRNQ